MKKPYTRPMLLIEHFDLMQQISSCTDIKIGFNSYQCVLKDSDAPSAVKALAALGYFNDNSCKLGVPENDLANDGLCVHTSVSSPSSQVIFSS